MRLSWSARSVKNLSVVGDSNIISNCVAMKYTGFEGLKKTAEI